jgi:NADH-quinone oxidoreductase subunit K
MIPLEYELLLSAILLIIGFYGILVRKNAIVVLMCIEIVLNAAIMNFVAFSSYSNNPTGQMFALIAIAIAAAEAAIGLAIFLVLYRTHGSIELDKIKILRW